MKTTNAGPGIALRLAPALTVAVLILPVVAGVAGVALPAFGYLPALGGDTFSLDPWRALMAMPGLRQSVSLSFTSALVTAFCSFALVQLFVAAWSGTRVFSLMQRALSPLLSVPHAAAAFALAFLFAPSGWIMRLLSPWATGFDRPPDVLVIHDPAGLAMMAGLIAKETPFLFLMTLAALPQLPVLRLGQVTSSFGYGRLAGFFKVILPLLYPQIRLPILAVIAYASSVVDVAMILGPTRPAPLAVQLTRWMSDPDLSLRFTACAGAMLQLGVTAAAIACWLAGERIVVATGRRWLTGGRRLARDGAARLAVAIMTFTLVCAMALGLVVLVLWSVSGFWPFPDALPPTMTLQSWVRALPQAANSILTTLWLGLAAVAAALVLTMACLEREVRTQQKPARSALGLVYVPLLVPQVAFLFGLQFLLLTAGIGTNAAALAFAHFLFVLPYVFLSLGEPWRAWDPRYGRVAASFGAHPSRIFWRIRLPMLSGAVLTAATVGFAVSVGQYLPTLLIGGGRFSTITTEAVALASGGNRRLISVYALLQTALPFAGFALALAIPAILFRNRRAMRTGA
ncbi:putative thiamine transport system permease protein [Breoghania corrubedonensis]|uniref:Putative thiamine transport system permease protein n=1 Tax=Breoghania corrubedonensis TaxID=665038 RepID=A0A2T5VFI3_9HYPH|nr:ABC transporter permease subunit [Breoghania corrubedonensis]PTW62521.1 putative thiamine transport system permease protein [Breoghania corrubedonensis]